MRSNNQLTTYRTYFFRFPEKQQQRIAGIYTLGWEKRNSASYYYDGLKRSEKGKIIFQYTLKGEGEIVIDNQVIRLTPGHAFFVNIPSNHTYYLPSDSEEWEFIHITLYGEEVWRSYHEIVKEHGNILRLEDTAYPNQLIFKLFDKAVHEEIKDAFESSSFAYTFIMELKRYLLHTTQSSKTIPESISDAIRYMQHHYSNPIILDDIVEASGLSKYHFSRLFQSIMQTSPMNFLTKIRLNKAIELMKDQNLTIEEIALRVGYSNGNYFTKVFKSIIGMSPGKYRNSENFVPFDEIIGLSSPFT
ncbi:AraC family transcriptional regulator [Niallia circulans]|uniref:AraC family transcriptional regulator n=1 Tax=Niallia circulans TaxID=1397 RepID=UPI000660B203|nr:AraC family transcriptional regulator [Niallia circulans]MCF2650265.1 AraC family transcriptional regulator [Niallia circulans]